MYKKEDAFKEGRSFTSGLIWNYISLIFMAVSGLCFSLLIGIFYDAEALGYFNTFYAVYVVLSQLAVFGCHNAIIKRISEKPDDIPRAKAFLLTACTVIFGMSVLLGIAFCTLFFAGCRGYFGIGGIELAAMSFGLLFFALNKAVLGYLNGLSRMKEYAVYQSLRYIFISGFILLFSLLKMPREYLVLSFLCAEALLLVCEIPSLLAGSAAHASYGNNDPGVSPYSVAEEDVSGVQQASFPVFRDRLKEIFVFGYRILPANFVLELNTRVDVLCLSFLTGDERIVGIYSFAALFAEGFYNLFVVIRRSVNPKITQEYVEGSLADFYDKACKKMRKIGYVAGAICGILILIVFWGGCGIFKDPSYREGIPVLALIMAAIVINLQSIVWGNILSQTGFPKKESVVNVTTVLSNFIMNIIFISLFGMIGAAIGTAVSYFVFALVQKLFVKKYVFAPKAAKEDE